MIRSRTLIVLPLVAAALHAQGVTLPAEATQWAGNLHNSGLFYASSSGPNEARTQLIYALADIPASLGAIQQIDFRPRGTLANRAATIDLEIAMSTSPIDPDSPDSVFAVNAPAPAVTVFVGTVALPATTTGTWPRPWSVQVPLQGSFALAPAPGDRSLVIDVRCRNNSGTSAWWAEEYGTVSTQLGQGTPILTQQSCLMPNGQPQTQSSFQPGLLHPGGRLSLTLGVYPSNQPSAAVNAFVIGLQAQGGRVGSLTLPVTLQQIGVNAPPNCAWTVEPAVALPITYTSYSWGGNLTTGQLVPIPNNRNLAGLRFYTQNAALLAYPTGLQVFPSVAMEFVIGDSVTPSGTTVSAAGNRFATAGVVSGTGPVSIRLQ